MSSYVSVLNPSTNNTEGHQKWLGGLYSAGVATHLGATQLQVVQRGAGANLSIDVSIGQCILALPSGLVSYWAWTDAATNVTIATADATNPRIDTIVAWVDQTVASSGTTNSLGALKFMSVAGTASGTPTAAADATIQTAVGASSAWIKLATVTVAAGATTITNAVITDARTQLGPTAVSKTVAIADAAITPVKWTNPYKFSAYTSGAWTAGVGTDALIPLNTKAYDTNNNFNTSTYRYVAPVAGYYLVQFMVTTDTSGGAGSVGALRMNGSRVITGQSVPTSYAGPFGTSYGGSKLLQLAANDYLDLVANSNGQSGHTSADQTFMSGFLVSQT
jgi:hypothetical protein